MPYTPPFSSGISFVFGGASYTPPSPSAIPFVFSQGGLDSVYVTGVIQAQFVVTAEGGAPVRGALSEAITLAVSVTGAAPVNGSVFAQPEFRAEATLANVGFADVTAPFSVFAYKVPDVTGAAVFTPPFVITAARSAGALFNIAFVPDGKGLHGITGESVISLRPKFSIEAASGRTATTSILMPLSVAGYSSITVESRLATALPIRVAAVGRSNVRGISGFTVPLGAAASGDVRLDGAAAVPLTFTVAANNANARMGTSRIACRFGISAQGAIGAGGSAQLTPEFSASGRGSQPRGGRVVTGLSVRVSAYGACGASGAGAVLFVPTAIAHGEHRGFVSGSVSMSLPIRVYGQGSRPLKYPEPGIHIKTTTKSLAVFQ